MLQIEDIIEVRKATLHDRGYEIVFPDNKIIWLTKRRTIAGLLLLIKYETCSEADLVGSNDRLKEIKRILGTKINQSWISDRYGDANKPFSELWTEEGFSSVHAEGLKGNRQYVLKKEDHDTLFNENAKSTRVQLSKSDQEQVLARQNNKCNFCGAILKRSTDIAPHSFAKDRLTMEFDHRIPIDRGGENTLTNYQALCHYCNKCKRQICFICDKECDETCALVAPEKSSIVKATNENVVDRLVRYAVGISDLLNQ